MLKLYRMLPGLLLLAVAAWSQQASAATITHTDVSDFQTGLSDGVAVPMFETATPAAGPAAGGVGILPGTGASLLNDDFNYATASAAQAAGWLFLKPNEFGIPELSFNPSEFLFSGDTSNSGGTAPPAGVLRLRVSRPQDLFGPQDPVKQQPVLALSNTLVTGDFIAEARFHYPEPLTIDEQRQNGVFIARATNYENGKATDLTIDDNSVMYFAGPGRLDTLYTTMRTFPNSGNPLQYSTTSFKSDTWIVRVVKLGSYYYTFAKPGDAAPWIFHEWAKMTEMAGTADAPLVVGVFGKSFGSTSDTLTQYRDVDFDYFHLNRPGTLAGTYTNVMDGGPAANWQTVSLDTHSMQGLRYQLRTGNTLSGGTLTDAGAFQGPDGTGNTYFEDDAAAVVPNGNGKRYLEYKLFLDQTPANLPAFLRSFSAIVQPGGIASRLASDASDFGPDAGNIQTQPGNGDLGLKRTTVFFDDFNSASLDPGWMFDSGYALVDPNAVGDYTLTEKPGTFRMKVGYEQNFDAGSAELGGVKLMRQIPAGVSDWEIETEITMEVQQGRQAALWAWQDNNNNLGVSVLRRNVNTWEIGLMEHIVVNDGQGSRTPVNYGSNTIQLRLTKRGQIFTLAARDTASPSPSWRVLRAINMAGQATGGTDFVPTQVGLLGKSYAGTGADRGVLDYDWSYFKLSTVADAGAMDVPFTLPAGNRVDTIIARGDALSALKTKFQVRDAGGAFVGPDGTGASYFTFNEPKLPVSLNGITTTQVRVALDNTTATGTPYLHAFGLQYATGSAVVLRDTNQADFAAGTGANTDITTTSGVLANGGGVSLGTPVRDDFNYTDNDLTTKPWEFDNPVDPATSNSGLSRYSFTDAPGKARLYIGPNEDTTRAGRPRAFLRRDDPVTGDWEIESQILFPIGRENGRITGIGLFEGTNYLIFGLRWVQGLSLRSSFSGITNYDANPSSLYPGEEYQLRIRKIGSKLEFYVKEPTASDWTLATTRTSTAIVSPQVGLFGLSVTNSQATPSTDFPVDYEYFTVTPISANGIFESRVLDLGASGLAPTFSAEGTSLPQIAFQFRAADTVAGLAGQAYLGPDGTAASTFAGDFSGALPASLSGKRYLQYKAVIPGGASINDVAILVPATGTATLTREDVLNALRIAGGLQAATLDQKSRYDVVGGTSAGRVDLLDAVQIAKRAAGGS